MLGCVIMAAGNAVRFGANKLEAELDGKPLIMCTRKEAAREVLARLGKRGRDGR